MITARDIGICECGECDDINSVLMVQVNLFNGDEKQAWTELDELLDRLLARVEHEQKGTE